MKLSTQETEVHNRALRFASELHNAEAQVVEVLRDVEKLKLYRKLGHRSLFEYAVNALGLERAVAYSCITVARKTSQIPELKAAVATRKISVYKASRLAPSLDRSNAKALIKFAEEHTTREVEQEVRRLDPKAAPPDKVKILSNNKVQLTVTVSIEDYKNIQRKQSLEAQKGNNNLSLGGAIGLSVAADIERIDPVRKAARAKLRAHGVQREYPRQIEQLATPILKTPERVPLTAAERHAVFEKCQGKCTHVDIHGKPCGSDRWVEVHHIVRVCDGGTNAPENLTLLCLFHHDRVHQLSVPIEGGFSYLRAPQVAYG